MKTYLLASRLPKPETRKAHIVTFERPNQKPIDVALYKTRGGYCADHPRSGYAVSAFDQISLYGPPVLLGEAKERLLIMLDGMDGFEKITQAAKRLPVLNPGYN